MHNLPKGKWIVLDALKSDSNLPKRDCIICFIESFLKIMKNGFYFKSFFLHYFWSYRENGPIRKISLISKFMISQPG